jgi:hypothetical protein
MDTQKMKAVSQIIDNIALEKTIEEGTKYPKVTVYSPIIAAVMRYREITTPRFKLSPEVEARLEKVLKKEDPKLWKAVENNSVLWILLEHGGKIERSRLRVKAAMRYAQLNPILDELVKEGRN